MNQPNLSGGAKPYRPRRARKVGAVSLLKTGLGKVPKTPKDPTRKLPTLPPVAGPPRRKLPSATRTAPAPAATPKKYGIRTKRVSKRKTF